MRIFLIVILLLTIFGISVVHAEQIFITVTSGAQNIIFDGKWTFYTEWKESSENIINFDDGSSLSIRSAHDYDNLYFLIDFISDTSFKRFADRGIVCIDSKMDKGDIPNEDDYCFSVTLGSKTPVTLRGNELLAQTGFFEKIKNHQDLIVAGEVSDENDRYTKIPHTSYEFKIPLEMFGKSDKYGFYVVTYDANTGKAYSWPKDPAIQANPFISQPKHWGELISPDKSIPEFPTPFLVIILGIFLAIYVTRTNFYQKISKR
ncbi:MAG TPA: hypothetical protein VD651_01295 [Nitrosarchaeum sp.]|nr:hypothetical protein [Nitrosarchaeum sp.]